MSATVGFQIILILATLLCSLIAGFLFAFASVVMPGIKKLNDGETALNNKKNPIKRLTPLFLFASGLLLLVIGGTILLVPHTFYANDGIMLGNDPSLLSEIRAPGGLLAGSAVLILIGTFRHGMRTLALTLTILVYGSFGFSRLLSLTLDGTPSNNLVAATVIELAMATISLIILCYRTNAESTVYSQKLTMTPETR